MPFQAQCYFKEKKKQLEQLEGKVQELQRKLSSKNDLIGQKNKELLELERQITAKKSS